MRLRTNEDIINLYKQKKKKKAEENKAVKFGTDHNSGGDMKDSRNEQRYSNFVAGDLPNSILKK